jgi:hypothetical protein
MRQYYLRNTGVTSAPGGVSVQEKKGESKDTLDKTAFQPRQKENTGLVGKEPCRTWCVRIRRLHEVTEHRIYEKYLIKHGAKFIEYAVTLHGSWLIYRNRF